jgi:hypothetical protein
LHFTDQTVYALSQRAFGGSSEQDGDALADQIYSRADEMRAPLRNFIRSNHLDLIIVQNALTIPMNLPLGVSLTGLIAELGIDTIAHHHERHSGPAGHCISRKTAQYSARDNKFDSQGTS